MPLLYRNMDTSVKGYRREPMTDRLERLTLQAMATKLGLHIGARIRQARLEAGLATQQQLADLLPSPISNQYVSKWEKGAKPKDETLKLIAAALHRDVGWFYEGFEKPKPTPDPFAGNGNGEDQVLARLRALETQLSQLSGKLDYAVAERTDSDAAIVQQIAALETTIRESLRRRRPA